MRDTCPPDTYHAIPMRDHTAGAADGRPHYTRGATVDCEQGGGALAVRVCVHALHAYIM